MYKRWRSDRGWHFITDGVQIEGGVLLDRGENPPDFSGFFGKHACRLEIRPNVQKREG